MHARAPSNHIGAALAATFLSGSCSANPILCNDTAAHASHQPICADDHRHSKPELSSALLQDGSRLGPKIDVGTENHNKHLFQPWHPLGAPDVWIRGGITARNGQWTQANLHLKTSGTVPEPSSLALLGIGLIGAAFSLRIKRR